MLNDSVLLQLKEQLQNNRKKVEGTVKAHADGFGFLETTKKKKTFYINHSNMRKVMHGDKIQAYIDIVNGKEQAIPDSLLSSYLSENFIARVILVKNKQQKTSIKLMIDHPLINDDIAARVNVKLDAPLKPNDYVLAKLIAHPLTEHTIFIAEIIEYICAEQDNYAPWLVTFSKYGISKERDKYNLDLAKEPTIIDNYPRVNLSELEFFTIDAANSKDLDDALYINPTYREEVLTGWQLKIAIADPCACIAPDSELDLLARERLTSSYYHFFNFPMLPKVFSENICSLLPNQSRPALVCSVDVDLGGAVIGTPHFELAIIESKAKLDYDTVAAYIEKYPNNENSEISASIGEQLLLLHNFSKARDNWREKNTMPAQNEFEYSFNFDRGVLSEINYRKVKTSHRIVEEAMVLANMIAANYLAEKHIYAIYNIHMGFNKKFLSFVEKFVKEKIFSANEAVGSFEDLEDYKKLWQKIATLDDSKYLQTRIRRYIGAAEYRNNSAPHFGLGIESYLTWTSPIRKYGDMLNHRILKQIINAETILPVANDICNQIAENRRFTRSVEMEITDWLYADFMQKKIDSIFNATIIDINKSGIKLQLIHNGAWVFVPMKFAKVDLENIRVDINEIALYEKDQRKYRLADEIQVKVTKIDHHSKIIYGQVQVI